MALGGRRQGEEGICEEAICGYEVVGGQEYGGFWAWSGMNQRVVVVLRLRHLQFSKGFFRLIGVQGRHYRLTWC